MTLIHPPLTAFPSALLTCAVVCELASLLLGSSAWRSRSSLFLYAACAAVPFTYISGYIGSEYANQSFEVPDTAISDHQSAALIFCLVLYLTLLFDGLLRASSQRFLAALRAAGLMSSFLLCVWTSYQGGQLVFVHGAAVSAEQNPVKQTGGLAD